MTRSEDPVQNGEGGAAAWQQFPSPNPPWTVLLVDDDPDYLRDTAAEIREHGAAPDGHPPHVITEQSFSKAQELLRSSTVDVVVLDVRDDHQATEGGPDDDRGVRVFEDLKKLRFVPVVFFTAIESRVQDLHEPPLVQVVSKADGSEAAAAAVELAFQSGAPVAVRALGDHVREVTRQYLWDHVGPKWSSYQEAPRDQLANLLTSRLAKSLEYTSAHELQGALGDAMPTPRDWHPSRMYVLPPLAEAHSTGDLVRDRDNSWSVLLTPACDLVSRSNGSCKADRILLARAEPLTEVPAFQAWLAADRAAQSSLAAQPLGGYQAGAAADHRSLQTASKKAAGELKALLSGTTLDRYFHLPGFFDIPDLLIDLQHIESHPHHDLSTLTLVASLNPPYSQALQARFTRYVGRVGLDEPDTDWLLDGFRSAARKSEESLEV